MIPFQISLPFKPIVKKNGNYIINFVTLRLTKVKLLKITSFLPFLTQIRQKFGPKRPLNLAFLAIIAISFHAGGFTTCFVTFFITLDLIQPKFCPKTTPDLIFFAKTSNNYYFQGQLVQKWGPHKAIAPIWLIFTYQIVLSPILYLRPIYCNALRHYLNQGYRCWNLS